MASARILASRSRVVAYLPNLRVAVRHFRAFSSYDERKPANTPVVVGTSVDQVHDPECHLGILAPQDKRFPMPGMQGPVRLGAEDLTPPPGADRPHPPPAADIFTEPLPAERQVGALGQFMIASRHLTEEDMNIELDDSPLPSALDHLECVALDCPELLKKEFADLFPERDLSQLSLTVITMSQKTENDMSGWSTDVEEERERLLDQFVHGAQDICTALKGAGYWADFIEPSSGRPFYGAFTNSTLFETDERYRQLGFEIEDLGCCRVIRHHVWGKHAYVGCLFTDAPHNHPIITDMTKDPEYM